MKEPIIIETDAVGKNLFETSMEICTGYASQLDGIHRWILEIEEYEKIEGLNKAGRDFVTLKNLYQLQSLFPIASADLSVIVSQMYINKIKLQHLFYNRQVNLTIYEAHCTYGSYKHFIRNLILESYPEFRAEFDQINSNERNFVRTYKIKTTVMNIRNMTGGHIDINFKAWYKTVAALDGEHDGKMVIGFMALFKQILNLTTRLTSSAHQKFIKFSVQSDRDIQTNIQKTEAYMVIGNANLPDRQKL